MDWGGRTGSSESVSQVASNIPASAGVRQPMEIGVVAISCIFLCCRGDRVLFLPREREVEVSSLGSLLKRKDMAKKRARSRTERGRRGGLYPEAVAGASLQTGREREKMWIAVCFPVRWSGQSSSHHSITALAARRSRCCPARNGQRTIGAAGKRCEIRHSSFSSAAQRPVCSWPSSFSSSGCDCVIALAL